jgi:hypothetical protein
LNEQRFGVRQLAAAFVQASLLAVQWSAVLGKRKQARGRKAAASCRTPKRLRRNPCIAFDVFSL